MRRATWSSRGKLYGERISKVGFRVAHLLWWALVGLAFDTCDDTFPRDIAPAWFARCAPPGCSIRG